MAQMEKLKVSSATWNSDTNPNGLTAFISQLDSMARACKGGPQLINFLDQKLKRKLRKVATVPSFISGDPDSRAGEFSWSHWCLCSCLQGHPAACVVWLTYAARTATPSGTQPGVLSPLRPALGPGT